MGPQEAASNRVSQGPRPPGAFLQKEKPLAMQASGVRSPGDTSSVSPKGTALLPPPSPLLRPVLLFCTKGPS